VFYGGTVNSYLEKVTVYRPGNAGKSRAETVANAAISCIFPQNALVFSAFDRGTVNSYLLLVDVTFSAQIGSNCLPSGGGKH
jgi:hypothetical protein